MFGFYRIAACVPSMKVADVEYNKAEIIACVKQCEAEGAAVAVFPELSLTGYTCGDLFHQELLIRQSAMALKDIALQFKNSNMLILAGLPVRNGGRLYNCAAILQNGKILAVIPKTFLPNHREFYEKRHFCSGYGVDDAVLNDFPDKPLFTVKTIFEFPDDIRIGVELCEDLWSPLPPSQYLAAAGANLILNLSASNALVSKSAYRRDLVVNQSARCMAVYLYTSSGVHESTTDTVFGGHALIAENGTLTAESERFSRESRIIYSDVDLHKINSLRFSEGSFQDAVVPFKICTVFPEKTLIPCDELKYRVVPPKPFVPGTLADRDTVCTEIFHIQCSALAKRLEASHAKTAVLGISGGLDSTLAMLVMAETFRMLKREPKDMIALTMPGFGTTDRTLSNACELSELLGCTLRKVDIRDACIQHFHDIGHDPAVLDVTYENVQARERTQILMDTANREHGMVVGTGDLSEIALGWSTYNADHMSMYAVNCGIPKTLVRHVVDWYADREGGKIGAVLKDVIDTPVSPELLPADKNGAIAQKTESILGPYELHDFFLYHIVKYGAEPAKLRYLAQYAFKDKYSAEIIEKTLSTFLRRFFTQQFKRSCIPDGPKVGTIALSPRADWRMPSDASAELWLDSIKK